MRRPRLSYANVISNIALFVALGGTGYAVTQLPRNSVGSRQLKANAVTAGDTSIGSISSQGAMTFAGTTQVSYVCSHAVAIAGAPRAENSWLLATRVGSLENRSGA